MNDSPVKLPISVFEMNWNPFKFHPWQEFEITESDVQDALNEGRLVSDWNSTDHAGRIAYLVQNESFDPIDIDVGVPDMGCHIEWIILDGNHRLSAAIFSKRDSILAYVSGSIDYAKEIFCVDFPDEMISICTSKQNE